MVSDTGLWTGLGTFRETGLIVLIVEGVLGLGVQVTVCGPKLWSWLCNSVCAVVPTAVPQTT